MAQEFGISIGAKLAEYAVGPLLRLVHPIFSFKSIVDDFRDTKRKLTEIRQGVSQDVQQARNAAQVINPNVSQWVEDVDVLMAEVDAVVNDVQQIEDHHICFRYSWCPNWTCHYKLSKRLFQMTRAMKTLLENGNFGSVAHPPPLHQHHVGSSSSATLMHSQSSKTAFDQIMAYLENDGVNIIGLYGETGMGKRMLAKLVAEEAKKHFERVVLITVSKDDELRSLQGVIADFLNLKLDQESVQGRASQLKLRLDGGEKILLILNGVWKEFDFKALGIPSVDGSCKILLTAHSRSHVPDGLQTQSNVLLATLPEDEAWALFQSIASIGDQVRAHDGAKNAIAECKGRPKALVMLARVLRGIGPDELDEALEQAHISKLKVTEDLEEQAKNLSERRERVETEIKEAKNNAQVIYKDVEDWLIDVKKAMKDKEQFMNEFNKSRYFFDDLTIVEELTVILKKLCTKGDFVKVSHASPLHQVLGSSSSNFMPSQSSRLVFNEILEALQKDDVNIIGLYGMGGIGKTTLAQQVQREVKRTKIFDHAVMVTVSQRPEVSSIQGTIAELLNLKLEQKTEEGRASKLNQRFKDGKILVILDDIWKRFDLKTIGIELNECKGCKILLTTRRKKVCVSMDCETSVQLNLLSDNEALEFFRKKACLSKELKLNVLIEEIVRECKGLPIALATVGAAIRNTGEDEWREALGKLRYSRLVDIDGVDNDDRNAFKCLRVSYDYLTHSAEAQEKQFILLLCSLYPEDRSIEVEDLSRYVFGMRLFPRVKSIEDARRKVRVIIRSLKESCLLLDVVSEDVVNEDYVKVHDVVRDAMLWIGGTESREKKVLIVRDESDLEEFTSNKSFQNCRAVSFMAGSVPVLSKYNQLVCPNLETILIFGGRHRVVELSNEFFEHMTSLKILDLKTIPAWMGSGSIKCRFEMPQSLCKLKDMRSLMLENCLCFNSSILREFTNLEILSLKDSEIDCGVEIVSGLKELRLLDLSGTKAGRDYPSVMIEPFPKLEELHGHVIKKCEVGENTSSSIEWELLSNLVALSVGIEDATCIPMGFCFPNLATYFIHVGTVYTNSFWSEASVMRCLELTGIEDESAIKNLCKELLPTVLHLRLLGWKDLCSLAVFTSQTLEILEIEDCYKMERVFEFEEKESIHNNINTVVQLHSLKKLRLIHLRQLKHVWKGPARSVSLRNLTQIDIRWCSKLTCVFPSPLLATTLQQLEMLRIISCHDLEDVIARGGDSDGDDLDNIQGVKAEDGNEEPVICFKKLKTLEVSKCGKLKTIFPISVAFPNLETLQLVDNAELENVLFGQSDWDCTCQYPFLKDLSIVGCPKLCTQFVAACIKNLSTTKAKNITLGHILGVEDVMQIEGSHLEKLSLQSLQDLKCMWRGPTQNICFLNLYRLEVIGCNRLKHLSDTTIATTLPNLTKLIIRRCNELEQVIVMAENGNELTDGLVFENLSTLNVSECEKLKTIFPIYTALPKLERLRIERNAELKHAFGQSDQDCTWKYPFLKDLCVVGCPKIYAQFAVVCIQNLSTAKHIRKIAIGCNQRAQDFIQPQSRNINEDYDNQFDDSEDSDSDLLFSFLKTMSLRNIAELKCIWHGPTQNICFANLSELEVIGCHGLKHIFAITTARTLSNLKKLIVRRCNELEQVITGDDDEWEDDAKAGIIAKVGLETLEVLYVSNCEKLKTIFSIFIPLPKLGCLRPESNAQLERLFGEPDWVCTSSSAYLETLSVTSCPKLCKQSIALIKNQLQPRPTSQGVRIINLSSIQEAEELVQFHRQEDGSVDETIQLETQSLKLEELGDLKRIWSWPTQDISFSFLYALRVIGCSRLKQLFTITMATSLHNLSLLSVERCYELEQVVEEEEEEDMNEENNTQSVQQLEFSRLRVLRLMDLPKLMRFCPISCNLLLPELPEKNLIVEGCPSPITEFFSQQSYKPADSHEIKLYEFNDDGKDEDDDSDDYYYFSPKSFLKLFGFRPVEEV